MLSHIDNFLVSSEPDIILLHLGTYGLENDQSPQEVADNISSLLDKIYTFNPNTVVVLAQIINRGLQVYNQDSEKMTDDSNINFFNDYKAPSNIRTLTTNYNSVLGDMANKRIMNGDKIILVNMEKAITDYNEDSSVFRFFPHGDMFDSFHPNQKGYNKMANVWFNALNNYFIDKPNLSWPENNSKNILTPITFTWSITSNAVSYTLQISKDQKFSSDSLIYNKVVTDRYAIVKNNFLLSKEYYWRVAAQTSKGQIIYSEVWNFTAQPITISAKVFLQGPYTGSDTMSTILNRYHFIPLTQPYNSDPWDYSGNEKVSQIPSGIVDWVLLELRTGLNSSTTVARRAAFIRSDGNIVDLDGNSPVTFSGITSEGYYLIVKHRNHLSIMSSDTLSCSHSTKYDFTTSLSKAYGKNSMADLGGGRFGMISGDNNNDKTISVSDYNLISTNLDRTGYRQPDNNMDGIISIADYNFVEANLFNYTKIP